MTRTFADTDSRLAPPAGKSGMKVVIYGAGYVGCVSGACLAEQGHEVVLVDVMPVKVEAINAGRSPITEPGLDSLIEAGVGQKRLAAVLSGEEAVDDADVVLVCVATPSRADGGVETKAMESVLRRLAEVSTGRSMPLPVAIRSTIGAPALRDAMAAAGLDHEQHPVRVVGNPEFLREGVGVRDFNEPPFVVVGGDDRQSVETVARLYSNINAPQFLVDLGTAMMVEYASNAFHARRSHSVIRWQR